MTYQWYRSWPSWWDNYEPNNGAPPHLRDRPYVVDSLPILEMSDFDYSTVKWPAIDDDGFCMLEWDIALDRQGREAFENFVHINSSLVAVAPYHLSDGRITARSLGCVYFPIPVLNEFLYLRDKHQAFTDTHFFDWYERNMGKDAIRVCTYNVYPQHLNS